MLVFLALTLGGRRPAWANLIAYSGVPAVVFTCLVPQNSSAEHLGSLNDGRVLPVWLVVVEVISCATLSAIIAPSVAPIVVSPILIAILISAWLITICAIVSGNFAEIRAITRTVAAASLIPMVIFSVFRSPIYQ